MATLGDFFRPYKSSVKERMLKDQQRKQIDQEYNEALSEEELREAKLRAALQTRHDPRRAVLTFDDAGKPWLIIPDGSENGFREEAVDTEETQITDGSTPPPDPDLPIDPPTDPDNPVAGGLPFDPDAEQTPTE